MDIYNNDNIKEIGNSGYYVDKVGNVYSTHYKKGNAIKVLKPCLLPNGYYCVHLFKINRNAQYIHRLVAQAFIPNPQNKPEVNHKDLDKSNNRVDNLEWVTRKENENHLKENNPCKGKTGSNSGSLYQGKRLIGHFRSLQKAKEYCRTHYHCWLSSAQDINTCYKNNLYFIKDKSNISIKTLLQQRPQVIKHNHTKQALLNKKQKGLAGSIYKNNVFIKSFFSIRDANQYICGCFKCRTPNLYICREYEYRVKCND